MAFHFLHRTHDEIRKDDIELVVKEIIEKKMTFEEWSKVFVSPDGSIDWNNCPEMVIRVRPNQVRFFIEPQMPLKVEDAQDRQPQG